MVAIPNSGSVIPEENTAGAQQVDCYLCLMVLRNTKICRFSQAHLLESVLGIS